MDDDVDIVKVSYHQLINDGKSCAKPSTRNKTADDYKANNKKKRPDQLLYQPAHRRKLDSSDLKEENEDDVMSDDSHEPKADKKYKRKPDKQIYVPKPRQERLRKRSENVECDEKELNAVITTAAVSPKLDTFADVDVKTNLLQDRKTVHESNLKITVFNDKAKNVGNCVAKENTRSKSQGPKSPEGKNRHNYKRTKSSDSEISNSSELSFLNLSSIPDWAAEVDEAEFNDNLAHEVSPKKLSPAKKRHPVKTNDILSDNIEFDFSKTLVFERSKDKPKPDEVLRNEIKETHQKPDHKDKGKHRYSEQTKRNKKTDQQVTNFKNTDYKEEIHSDLRCDSEIESEKIVGQKPNRDNSFNRQRQEHASHNRTRDENRMTKKYDHRQNNKGKSDILPVHNSERKLDGPKSASPTNRHVKFTFDKDSPMQIDFLEGNKTKVGGIIVLPKDTVDVVPALSNRGRGRNQGRVRQSSGGRSLYDPNNPQPSSVNSNGQNQELKFFDPSEPHLQDMPSNPQSVPVRFQYPPNYGYDVYAMPRVPFPAPAPYYTGDPHGWETSYYQHEIEMHVGPSAQSRPTLTGTSTTQAEHILKLVVGLDREVISIVSQRVPNREGLHRLHHIRSELVKKCDELICTYPDFSNKHSIEHILWKAAFYSVIEMYRKQLHDDPDNDTRSQLMQIIDQGVSFYENLLKRVQIIFKFDVEDYIDSSHVIVEGISRTVKLALLSCQRMMICLGDIARYKEQSKTSDTCNYGKARSWYLKAQQLAPKNGKPYNQLAILAVYTRRKLDAVYYYIRSLSASNPFLSAREGLMSLFDEARRKCEASEKRKDGTVATHNIVDKQRTEIWIGLPSTEELKEDEIQTSQSSAVQQNKKFVVSFLHIHGKLFTKIGMEMFAAPCKVMLNEMRELLLFGASAISSQRLLQLMVINMFTIENTALRDLRMKVEFRSVLQEHALQVGLFMFSLLVERCIKLFKDHLQSPDYPRLMMNDEIHNIYPSIKIWCDWMLCHQVLWNPSPRDMTTMPGFNVWENVADLCNVLKDIDISHVKFYTTRKEGCDPVILPEDVMMAGFVPLLSAPQDTAYVHATVDKEIAQDCFRIERLQLFADYLCGIEPPTLMYNVKSKKYEPNVDELDSGSEYEDSEGSGTTQSEDEDDVIVEERKEQVHEESHVQDLRAKKAELERIVQEQQKYRENVQSVLENANRPVVLRIIPVFLIPDTNGFISYLPEIKRLVNTKKYTIIVPLVVINELDGLALGSQCDKYSSEEHASQVKNGAKSAVSFLEVEFQARNSRIKCVTAKGNVLDTIAFRSEENSEKTNNDDIILSCCVHYCQDKARDFMPQHKDTPITLHREVVLLTADRNLRVKAHARNVPTKDIPTFLKWANI